MQEVFRIESDFLRTCGQGFDELFAAGGGDGDTFYSVLFNLILTY